MTTAPMLAYHNDPAIKASILATLARHRAAGELVQGGKGSAVGCAINSSETRFGIPVALARLEEAIFEGLPVAKARQWPERFMGAIEPGADLSSVSWQFLHWLLTDKAVNPGIDDPLVCDAVKRCADAIAVRAAGGDHGDQATVSAWSAWSATESAASAARSAAASAARSAAASAAWSAAASAAWSAAWSAASAARSAAASAESRAYVVMANKLIDLLGASTGRGRGT